MIKIGALSSTVTLVVNDGSLLRNVVISSIVAYKSASFVKYSPPCQMRIGDTVISGVLVSTDGNRATVKTPDGLVVAKYTTLNIESSTANVVDSYIVKCEDIVKVTYTTNAVTWSPLIVFEMDTNEDMTVEIAVSAKILFNTENDNILIPTLVQGPYERTLMSPIPTGTSIMDLDRYSVEYQLTHLIDLDRGCTKGYADLYAIFIAPFDIPEGETRVIHPDESVHISREASRKKMDPIMMHISTTNVSYSLVSNGDTIDVIISSRVPIHASVIKRGLVSKPKGPKPWHYGEGACVWAGPYNPARHQNVWKTISL